MNSIISLKYLITVIFIGLSKYLGTLVVVKDFSVDIYGNSVSLGNVVMHNYQPQLYMTDLVRVVTTIFRLGCTFISPENNVIKSCGWINKRTTHWHRRQQ